MGVEWQIMAGDGGEHPPSDLDIDCVKKINLFVYHVQIT